VCAPCWISFSFVRTYCAVCYRQFTIIRVVASRRYTGRRGPSKMLYSKAGFSIFSEAKWWVPPPNFYSQGFN
jgi:hypothetical protein